MKVHVSKDIKQCRHKKASNKVYSFKIMSKIENWRMYWLVNVEHIQKIDQRLTKIFKIQVLAVEFNYLSGC